MGYSLSKMADFQNRLISWIFGVFSSGYLHRTTLMGLYNRFSHVFGIFNFWPKLTILQRLWPLQDGRFTKSSHLCNIWWFLKRFFAQKHFQVIVQSICLCFLEFEIFTQTDHFARTIAFTRGPILKIVSFLEYLVFFRAVFCTEQR